MELEVIKFDHFGRSIAYDNDKIFFVNKAIPSEIVNVRITKDKKKYCEAEIIHVLKESNDRITPICPYYDKCGGCNLLHVTYDKEKEFKINKAKELLGRCDCFHETNNLNYRNKVTLHILNNEIGLYEEKSNKIIPINNCYLLNENINRVIKDLQNINLINVKTIIIKSNLDKIMVYFDNSVSDEIIDKLGYVDTIVCNKKLVNGTGYLEEIIDGKIFKITANAFFQVNKEGLININNVIKEYLSNKNVNKALDLYSGTSLWGILISNLVKKVTCIEINKEACLNAKANIKRNNVSNITIINGKVEDYIDTFNNIDLVIIDPPRICLDKKTREYLEKINSMYLIYVSCDMLTLKRDLEELKKIYDVERIELVDMFKRTYHVETVVLMKKRMGYGRIN